MTSGFMQSLLLFTQTITFINLTLSPTLSKTSQTLVRIHTFLLGFLNLDFFRLDQLSFCLWSGATVLDNLAFRYVTTFFTILLLAVFIIMVKQNIFSVKKLTERFKVCEKLKKAAGKTKLGKYVIQPGHRSPDINMPHPLLYTVHYSIHPDPYPPHTLWGRWENSRCCCPPTR